MPTIAEFIDSGFQKLDQLTQRVTQLTQRVASSVDISTSTKGSIADMASMLDEVRGRVANTMQKVDELDRSLDSVGESVVELLDLLTARNEERVSIRTLLRGLEIDTQRVVLAVAGEQGSDSPLKSFRGKSNYWKSWSRSASSGWTYAHINDPESGNIDAFVTRDIKASLVLSLSNMTKVPLLVRGSVVARIDLLPAEIRQEIDEQSANLWEGSELVVHWLEYIEVDQRLDSITDRDAYTLEARSYDNHIVAYVSRNNRYHSGVHPNLFELKTLHKPGSQDFTLGPVKEMGDGYYLLTLSPDPPPFRWERGSYLFALTVTALGSQRPSTLVSI